VTIGYGNPTSRGPIQRAWCIQEATFRPFMDGGTDTPSTGEPGRTRLFVNSTRIASDTCSAQECGDETINIGPARQLAPAGSTIRYDFRCINNPGTPEDECTDAFPGGSTIEIRYIVVRNT
jgi:hypothetical protein